MGAACQDMAVGPVIVNYQQLFATSLGWRSVSVFCLGDAIKALIVK